MAPIPPTLNDLSKLRVGSYICPNPESKPSKPTTKMTTTNTPTGIKPPVSTKSPLTPPPKLPPTTATTPSSPHFESYMRTLSNQMHSFAKNPPPSSSRATLDLPRGPPIGQTTPPPAPKQSAAEPTTTIKPDTERPAPRAAKRSTSTPTPATPSPPPRKTPLSAAPPSSLAGKAPQVTRPRDPDRRARAEQLERAAEQQAAKQTILQLMAEAEVEYNAKVKARALKASTSKEKQRSKHDMLVEISRAVMRGVEVEELKRLFGERECAEFEKTGAMETLRRFAKEKKEKEREREKREKREKKEKKEKEREKEREREMRAELESKMLEFEAKILGIEAKKAELEVKKPDLEVKKPDLEAKTVENGPVKGKGEVQVEEWEIVEASDDEEECGEEEGDDGEGWEICL